MLDVFEDDLEDRLCWWCRREIGYGVDPNTAGDEEPLHYWCTPKALRASRRDYIVVWFQMRIDLMVSRVRKSLLRKG